MIPSLNGMVSSSKTLQYTGGNCEGQAKRRARFLSGWFLGGYECHFDSARALYTAILQGHYGAVLW